MTLHIGNYHYWTISVQIVFYLFFPLICLIIQKAGYRISCVIIGLFVVLWVLEGFDLINISYEDVWKYVPMLLPGVLVSLRKNHVGSKNDKMDVFLLPACISYIFSGFILYPNMENWNLKIESIKSVYGIIIFSLAIYAIVIRVTIRNIMESERLKFIQRIGIVSYQIYLFHYIVLFGIAKVINPLEDRKPIISATVISLCIIGVLVYFRYNYIQRPVNTVGYRLIKWTERLFYRNPKDKSCK